MSAPDLAQAIRFLELLDEDAEFFTFQCATDDPAVKKACPKDARGRPQDPHARVIHLPTDHLGPLATANRDGAAVWVCINETDRKGREKGNIIRARAVFIDGDGQVTLDQLLGLELEPHIITETSPGHLQAFWKVDGLDLDQAEGVQRKLAQIFGTDAICDRCRVMRVPGFLHQKDPANPHMVRIIHVSERLPYKPADILRTWPPITAGPKMSNGDARESDLPHATPEPASEGMVQTLLRNTPKLRPIWDKDPEYAAEHLGKDRSQSVWDMALVNRLRDLPNAEIWSILAAYRLTHDPSDRKWQRRAYVERTLETAREADGAAAGWTENGEAAPGPAGFRNGGAAAGAEAWPEAQPLPQGLPPVEPFALEMLPGAFSPWVADVAERMQVPPDYVAIPAMVALGSVIGRQIGIYPKRFDDWLVVPNLWGFLIGRPSLLKSPSSQEALLPLNAMEERCKVEHEAEMKLAAARREVEAEAKKVRASDIRSALKAKQHPEILARAMAGEQRDEPEPVRRRFVTNEVTVEKLGELLRDNPNGLLVFRDELMGWFRSLEKEGRESDRAFYLEAWNGTGRFTYDRISRGTVDIEAACASILGCTTPGPIVSYLQSSAWSDGSSDGLLQRFQLAVWPDVPPAWEDVDRPVDLAARDRARAVFERCSTLLAGQVGAAGGHAVPGLRFDSEAQEAFTAWRATLERRLRAGNLHPAFEAHLAKYRSLLPSLALICQLADVGFGPVGLAAFARAEAWCRYLESHARRIYDALLRSDQAAARALGERITSGDLPSPFKLRDVYRPCWAGLTTRGAAQEAVDVLCDLGWLKPEEPRPGGAGGRPTTVWHINPKVRAGSGSVEAEPQERRGSVSSVRPPF